MVYIVPGSGRNVEAISKRWSSVRRAKGEGVQQSAVPFHNWLKHACRQHHWGGDILRLNARSSNQ